MMLQKKPLPTPLHTDEHGGVWRDGRGHRPAPTNLDDVGPGGACLMATVHNAPLIVALHDLGVPVVLLSPAGLGGVLGRVTVETAMGAMVPHLARLTWPSTDRTIKTPPSLGGPQRLTARQLPAYRIAAHHADGDDAAARAELEAWALWDHLSFVPNVDLDAMTRLIGIVLDPRWFVPPDEPERSHLAEYLQVRTASLAAPEPPPRFALLGRAFGVGADVLARAPGAFAHRAQALATRVSRRSDLVGRQLWVDFLAAAWLEVLTRGQRPEIEPAGLDPTVFFNAPWGGPSVVDAYRAHVEDRARCRTSNLKS